MWRKAGGGRVEREVLVARQQVADSQSRNPVAGQSQTIPDPKRWKTGSVTILGGSLTTTHLFQMTAQEPVLSWDICASYFTGVAIANMFSLFWPKVFPWAWTMYMPPLQRVNLLKNWFRLLLRKSFVPLLAADTCNTAHTSVADRLSLTLLTSQLPQPTCSSWGTWPSSRTLAQIWSPLRHMWLLHGTPVMHEKSEQVVSEQHYGRVVENKKMGKV